MSTPEDNAPQPAAQDDASARSDEAPAGRGGHPADEGVAESAESAADALSPAVRRLVRQFDLDITGIHGTGPSGRIRVSDVMSVLGGRTDSGNRDAPLRTAVPEHDAAADDADPDEHEEPPDDSEPSAGAGSDPLPAAVSQVPAAVAVPTTTVFDCDLSRVLTHRKKLRGNNVELLTTSYFLTALAAALDTAPEITAGHAPRFGVWLTLPDGTQHSALVDISTVSWDAALDERVRAVDAALRANFGATNAAANLLVHHYGESGSVLATPTPIGDDHAASVGIGRVRREVVVRTVSGAEAPRLAALCYLSLSFFADRVPLHHANRALADAVRILETWPE